MKTLYMKIHAFDEKSYSLLVSFASDETKYQDPSLYPAYAYQPMNMWPDVSDPAEIKKRIAQAGIYHAQQQYNEEQFVADPVKVASYKAMVGSDSTYDVNDLVTDSNPIIEV